MRGRERQEWLIQLANREGAWPKRPYECFWSNVGVSRIGQGNNLIHGGFGSTWEDNYYMGTQNGSKLEI